MKVHAPAPIRHEPYQPPSAARVLQSCALGLLALSGASARGLHGAQPTQGALDVPQGKSYDVARVHIQVRYALPQNVPASAPAFCALAGPLVQFASFLDYVGQSVIPDNAQSTPCPDGGDMFFTSVDESSDLVRGNLVGCVSGDTTFDGPYVMSSNSSTYDLQLSGPVTQACRVDLLSKQRSTFCGVLTTTIGTHCA